MSDTAPATAPTAEGPAPEAAPVEVSWGGFIALVWSLTIPILCAVAAFALYLSHKWRSRNKDTEAFITARGQASKYRIAWTFFAGALGAWVIAGPASYASYAGMIGLVFYALASGLPVIMTAYAGGIISGKMPHVLSLTDFMGWRYGWIAKTYVVLLCIFNMGIALLAEYTAIGSLFKYYLGSEDYPIILVVGILTMAYTAYGGLLVSLVTDQVQGVLALFLTIIAGIYLACAFDAPLPPMDSVVAGTTLYGYSAIFVMPASLFAATVFSEAMWQRAWAADSQRNLHIGAFIGAAGIIFVVFVFGLMGWLATWGGLIDFATANPNLYAFYGLMGSINTSTGTINNWIGVIVLICAAVMNMGAVDSLQNGLAGAISSHLFKNGVPWRRAKNNFTKEQQENRWINYLFDALFMTRLLVLIVNAILIIIVVVMASKNEPLDVLSLFLIANMIACTSAVPVLIGILDCIEPYYGGVSMILSCFGAFFFTSVYGCDYCWNKQLLYDETSFTWDCVATGEGDSSSYFSDGMTYTWYRNGYRWEYFLIAVCTSLGSALCCIAFHYTLQKFGMEAKPVLGFHPESKKHLAVNIPADGDIVKEGAPAVGEVGDDLKKDSSEGSQ